MKKFQHRLPFRKTYYTKAWYGLVKWFMEGGHIFAVLIIFVVLFEIFKVHFAVCLCVGAGDGGDMTYT